MNEPDALDADPREAKLPGWVREQLGALRGEVRHLRADNARAEARMAEHVDAEPDSDTVLTDPLGGIIEIPDRPLGNGAVIRFADCYEVHYGDTGSGARALIVESYDPLAVRPVHRSEIIVSRA